MSNSAPTPEARRSGLLREYGVRDGNRSALFYDTARLAADACHAPIAALSVFDAGHEHFIRVHGDEFDPVPIEKSLGIHVLRSHSEVVIENATEDQRARDALLVNRAPHLRFYAAVPLITLDRVVIGALAVMDRVPRQLTSREQQALHDLAGQAVLDLEMDRTSREGKASGSATLNEADFRRLFKSVPGICWAVDAKTHCLVAVNYGTLDLLDKRIEEMHGKHFTEAFPTDVSNPDVRAAIQQARDSFDRVKKLKHSEDLAIQAYPITGPDGSLETHYWTGTNVPVIGSDGEVKYIVHRAEDVTEFVRVRESEGKGLLQAKWSDLQGRAARMEAEIVQRTQELKRLNEHMRMAQRVASIGSWELHLKEHRRIWSDEMHEILGINPDAREEGLDAILRVVHPDDRELLIDARERASKGESPLEFEHRIIRPDGDVRVVRERAELIRDEESGEPAVLYGTLQDVTEQKSAREELERRARQQEAVARFGQRVLEGMTLQQLRDEAVQLVTATLQVDYCKILELLPDKSGMKLVAGIGWKEGFVDNATVGIDRESQAGFTLRSKEPVIVEDLRTETRFSGPPLLHEHEVVSGLSVIIQGDGGPWGVMGAHTRYKRHFTADDIHFFQSIANIVAEATQRVTAEAALTEKEQRFRTVAKATADTIWDWNLSTDEVWWNEGLEAVFGYSGLEIEPDSRSFRSRIHCDQAQAFMESVARALDPKEPDAWTAEYRFLRRDGRYADTELRAFVIRDEKGEPVRIVGAINDVTEKREHEKRLEQQAALLDKAQDAIIVRKVDGTVTFWNKSAERIYGWFAEEAVGRKKTELLNPDREAYEAATRTLRETGEWCGQMVQHRKDGGKLTVEATWSLVTNDGGQPEAVLCIDTDITERLALEEQLRQSQRLEAVGQLTGGVAHDFNNLLTVILGNAELMTDQLEGNPRLYKLAEMTRSAALRGAELTHRLLAFARRQALEPKVIDVNQLVIGMEGLLRRALPENIDIEVVQARELWAAFVDPAQLESVLLNLALNSKDAMHEGGKMTIETSNMHLDEEYVRHHTEVAPGRYVMIAVSDTGVGIPPEALERVFDPFYTTKEKGKGTGLGLSMAYGFAKQSGGHIKIYSEPGQGTTVRLYVPRDTRPGEKTSTAVSDESEFAGTEKILAVEDDDMVRSHAENQLRDFGYDVISARNGAEALEIIRNNPDIDLLFTDVIMSGGMNGRDLAEKARKIRPNLKVLYTSGYTENAIVHHGRLDAGVQLLQKPYRRADLAGKVRQALSKIDNSDQVE